MPRLVLNQKLCQPNHGASCMEQLWRIRRMHPEGYSRIDKFSPRRRFSCELPRSYFLFTSIPAKVLLLVNMKACCARYAFSFIQPLASARSSLSLSHVRSSRVLYQRVTVRVVALVLISR
jgi:hypothetical protein